jgi:hypothetical protein
MAVCVMLSEAKHLILCPGAGGNRARRLMRSFVPSAGWRIGTQDDRKEHRFLLTNDTGESLGRAARRQTPPIGAGGLKWVRRR